MDQMENPEYTAYMDRKHREFERICAQCGACCGADSDPCEWLSLDPDGRYYCGDYDNRLGEKRTVSGKAFDCVRIREHIAAGTLRPGCAYRN
ncbi:MAG: hypothetical protein GF392_04745, partial [Candidatus Omnitrophica bacterium]|nr:hypothetical protein [Candidatus Omnitrophota bacterium]